MFLLLKEKRDSPSKSKMSYCKCNLLWEDRSDDVCECFPWSYTSLSLAEALLLYFQKCSWESGKPYLQYFQLELKMYLFKICIYKKFISEEDLQWL